MTERFGQIEPKVLFSVLSVFSNGKVHDQKQKLKDVIESSI